MEGENFPPTVDSHTQKSDGSLVLHTIDPDHDTDIVVDDPLA